MKFRQASALLEFVHGAGGHARHIIGQQVFRGGRHPVLEGDLLELAGVPGLNDLQVLVAGVEDCVPEARRDVGGRRRP